MYEYHIMPIKMLEIDIWQSGSVDMVEWFAERCYAFERKVNVAVTHAATHGHLQVVIHLLKREHLTINENIYSNILDRYEKTRDSVIDYKQKILEILRWIYAEYKYPINQLLMDKMIPKHSTDIIDILVTMGCPLTELSFHSAVNHLAYNVILVSII